MRSKSATFSKIQSPETKDESPRKNNDSDTNLLVDEQILKDGLFIQCHHKMVISKKPNSKQSSVIKS